MPVLGEIASVTSRADPATVARAFEGLPPGRILSLDPTGDTGLALATQGHDVDVLVSTPAQAALVDLKLAALAELAAPAGRSLFGLGPPGRRVWFLHAVRGRLSPASQAWWDTREPVVRVGVLGAGRWEAHLARFSTAVRGVLPDQALAELRDAPDRHAHQAAVARWCSSPRWELLVRAAFSPKLRRPLGLAGPGRPAVPFPRRLARALARERVPLSPRVEQLLFGSWIADDRGPAWLSPEGWKERRQAATRVHPIPPPTSGAWPGAPYDALDLSLVADSLTPEALAALLPRAIAAVRAGGQLLAAEGDARLPHLPSTFVEEPAQQLLEADLAPYVSAIRLFRRI